MSFKDEIHLDIFSGDSKKEFLLFSRIMIYIQDPIVSDLVDFNQVTKCKNQWVKDILTG